MKKPSATKSRLARLFITACVLAIIISIATLLVRFEILGPFRAILIGTAAFIGFILIQRQFTLVSDVKTLKAQALGSEGFEDGVERRIEALSQQMTKVAEHSETEIDRNNNSIQVKLVEFEDRLIKAERGPTALPNASMAPFHEAKEKLDSEIEQGIPNETSLKSALQGDALQMHLQPIVGLPSQSPSFFEAFMRLRTVSKEYLDTNEFNKLAEDGGLMPAIDTKILFSSVRLIRTLEKANKSAGLFCSLSASTLDDAKVFAQILDFLGKNKSLNRSLILEISQRTYTALKADERARLKQVNDLGFALSLGNVADLNLKIKELAAQGFKFIKLPASILLHANLNKEDIGIHPSELSTTATKHGITVVAMEIEREEQAIGLIDLHMEYGQGILFAPPRAVKAELLETQN